jgi:HEAT repeat protein
MALFEAAEVQVVGADATGYDVTLRIRVSGKPLSRKVNGDVVFCGVDVKGEIVLEGRGAPLEAKFTAHKAIDGPHAWLYSMAKSPELGPWLDGLADSDCVGALAHVIGQAFGRSDREILERVVRGESRSVENAYVVTHIMAGAAVALAPLGKAEVPLLTKRLVGDGKMDRWPFALGLYRMGEAGATPLIEAMKSKDVNVRWSALWALGLSDSPESANVVLTCLKDNDPEIRVLAVHILGSRHIDHALAAMGEGLRDKDVHVRRATAMALGDMGKAAVKDLSDAIADSDAMVRSLSASSLGNIQDESAIPVLAGLLKDGDYGVRWRSMQALANIGGAGAAEPLIRLLSDVQIGYEVDEFLVRIGPPAVDGLIAALQSPSMEARADAARVLGQIKDDRALPALQKVADHPASRDGHAAVEALGKILFRKNPFESLLPALSQPQSGIYNGMKVCINIEEEYEQARPGLLKREATEATSAFLRLEGFQIVTKGDEPTEATVNIRLKGTLKDGKTGLLASLQGTLTLEKRDLKRSVTLDPSGSGPATAPETGYMHAFDAARFVSCVLNLLLPSEKQEARRVLIAVVVDQSLEVSIRYQALYELGQSGGDEVPAVLMAALRDPASIMRQGAARALGNLREKAAVELLGETLSDPDISVRSFALQALARIGTPRSAELLVGVLGEQDVSLQMAANLSLAQMGELAVPPLLKAIKGDAPQLRQRAEVVLCLINSPEALNPLLVALKEKDENVRLVVLKALAHQKDKRAVMALIDALKTDREDQGLAAGSSLKRIGEPAVLPLVAALQSTDWRTQVRAAATLAAIGDERAVEPLARLAKEATDPRVRIAAEETLKILQKVEDTEEKGKRPART